LGPVYKPDDVEEVYRAGLATTITQEFRTYSRVSSEEANKLDDPEYLKGVITGYTVDFLHSLRLSQRLGINLNTALDVARLSYHYNPTKLIQLVRQYPDVNLSVVQTAALGYPKNPEAFLNGFIANVARLAEDPRFSALNPSVINSAALSYPKNPEAFLNGFIANVARLKPLYPDLPPSAITIAALNWPNKPEIYLDKIRRGEILPTVEGETLLPAEELQEVIEDIASTDAPIAANGDVYNGADNTEDTTA